MKNALGIEMRQITYQVGGCTSFPTDMLRYDSAEPATQGDAALIRECSTIPYLLNPYPVRIRLRSLYMATCGRWQSFGWPVNGEYSNKEARHA